MKNILPLGLLLAFGVLANSASASTCSSCVCPHAIPVDCYTASTSSCSGTYGELTTTDGTPGSPSALTSVECDNCDSETGVSCDYSYSKTSGHKFTLCIGGEYGMEMPVGPNWKVTAEGCYEYNSETTTEISSNFPVGACSKKGLTVLVQTIPMTISQPITVAKTQNWSRNWFGCGDYPSTKVTTNANCGTDYVNTTSSRKHYTLDFDDLECPPKPCPPCQN